MPVKITQIFPTNKNMKPFMEIVLGFILLLLSEILIKLPRIELEFAFKPSSI